MFFDTHAHLDDEKFSPDRDELISSFAQSGVTRVLNASSDMESCFETVRLCQKYDFIYGAVGIHPEAADRFCEDDLQKIAGLSREKNIVAIGEVGLDYYWDDVPREIQKEVFRKQAALAEELALPLVAHDRDAHRDTLEILKEFPALRVVYHCFSGSAEYARELVKLGYYFSFGGAVTFKNARHSHEVLLSVPHERIMLETDCPYMAPVPYRGKRNHSGYIPHIAEKIAEIRGVSSEEVGRITTDNAKRFFGI